MTRAYYEARGYADMSARADWRISDCPYSGWQRDAWQAGAWRYLTEQRRKKSK